MERPDVTVFDRSSKWVIVVLLVAHFSQKLVGQVVTALVRDRGKIQGKFATGRYCIRGCS